MFTPSLIAAVRKLLKSGSVKNPSDARELEHALAHPELCDIGSTTAWMASVVRRRGARYDDNNPDHKGPHTWPLAA